MELDVRALYIATLCMCGVIGVLTAILYGTITRRARASHQHQKHYVIYRGLLTDLVTDTTDDASGLVGGADDPALADALVDISSLVSYSDLGKLRKHLDGVHILDTYRSNTTRRRARDRLEAIRILEALGGSRNLEVLGALIDDTHPIVRARALQALEAIRLNERDTRHTHVTIVATIVTLLTHALQQAVKHDVGTRELSLLRANLKHYTTLAETAGTTPLSTT